MHRTSFYEKMPDMDQAISRENDIEKWKRQWKMELIHSMNPEMIDLAESWHDKERIEEVRNMDDEDLF